MDYEDVEVTKEFFLPLTSVSVDRPRCQMFQRTWATYMAKYPSYALEDSLQRIMSLVTYSEDTSKESIVYSARIASSIAVWFGANNGFSFMEKLRASFDRKAPSYNNGENIEKAVALWGLENSLYKKSGGWGGRILQRLIQERKTESEELRPLTYFETDTAEKFMMWLATDDGRKLLDLFKRASDRYFEAKKKERAERTKKSTE